VATYLHAHNVKLCDLTCAIDCTGALLRTSNSHIVSSAFALYNSECLFLMRLKAKGSGDCMKHR